MHELSVRKSGQMIFVLGTAHARTPRAHTLASFVDLHVLDWFWHTMHAANGAANGIRGYR